MNINCRNGFKPRIEIEWDLNDYCKYSYKDFIPTGFSKGYVHDVALAATIIHAEGLKQGIPYITEWELGEIADWAHNLDSRFCSEVAKSCKRLAKRIN